MTVHSRWVALLINDSVPDLRPDIVTPTRLDGLDEIDGGGSCLDYDPLLHGVENQTD